MLAETKVNLKLAILTYMLFAESITFWRPNFYISEKILKIIFWGLQREEIEFTDPALTVLSLFSFIFNYILCLYFSSIF